MEVVPSITTYTCLFFLLIVNLRNPSMSVHRKHLIFLKDVFILSTLLYAATSVYKIISCETEIHRYSARSTLRTNVSRSLYSMACVNSERLVYRIQV